MCTQPLPDKPSAVAAAETATSNSADKITLQLDEQIGAFKISLSLESNELAEKKEAG